MLFWIVASVALTATAGDHGGSPRDGFPIVPALTVVSALTLLLGFALRKRRQAVR